MSQKGKIPAEEKMRIVELYLSGKVRYSSACREAGVDKATFRKWLSRYKTEGPSGFLPKENNRKYTKETKLSAVLDYLAGQGSMLEICEKYGVKHPRWRYFIVNALIVLKSNHPLNGWSGDFDIKGVKSQQLS
ncbi:transposase [Desulfosporosinus lacus]|uniref:Helix-turn-helix domain-containing protein n=1 Tax=Desulfosporosinus lacus DSM 15449 TaxID=1121420 RepID=A0A1M5ZU97_9FIRM|nr:transposase [Desulfosporosinus lacus]SHI27820.1 Helix-turn-helix domain-containing protein [Desulfosporosinus lacus DSM 15449]